MKRFLCFLLFLFYLRAFSQEAIEFQNLFYTNPTDSIACYRIPALVTAPNGDLLAAIDERVPSCNDLRDNADINIVLRRSTDHGATWLPMQRIIDFPWGKSASDPSFIVDQQTGEIFLFYNFMDLVQEKNIYYFHVVSSTDNGNSWSKTRDVTSQISKEEWRNDFKFITSGRGIQTDSGSLLHTMVHLEKGVFVFGSHDHGENWFLWDNALSPGDESKIVELADGRFLVNSRVNGSGIRYHHISDNQGVSWYTEAVKELSDPSCNASMLRIPMEGGNGTDILLFSNPKSVTERKRLCIRASRDNGKTWSEGKTIYDGPAAYSSMTRIANDAIGILFEKDRYTENVFAKLPLKWLLEEDNLDIDE